MRVVDWMRHHKARSGLVAVALANFLYLLWCTIADTPTSSASKLLVPVLILLAVFLNRPEGRRVSHQTGHSVRADLQTSAPTAANYPA
jgi:hypothetical protein